MAEKKLIDGLLKTFSGIWDRPKEASVIEAYYHVLKGYSDKQVKDAAYECMDECKFFPRPADITERIKAKYANDEHTKEEAERYICQACHQKVTAIHEGRCLDCAGFPPANEDRVKLPEIDNTPFVLEGRRKCQKCGKITVCIDEPPGFNTWECADCYSGMTAKERVAKFRQIVAGMKKPKFKPPEYDTEKIEFDKLPPGYPRPRQWEIDRMDELRKQLVMLQIQEDKEKKLKNEPLDETPF